MHSTFRTELRGTQRVFELLRSRTARHVVHNSRSFSHQTYLRDQANTGPNCKPSAKQAGTGEKPSFVDVSVSPKAAELALELEKWINHLSKNGMSLHVWDTISEQDDKGRWRLLPHVKDNLREISKWATEDGKRRHRAFGLKIADGTIRPLTSQELKTERESGRTSSRQRNTEPTTADSLVKGLEVQPQEISTVISIEKPAESIQQSKQEVESTVELEKSTGGDTPPKEVDNGVAAKFYGSSSARRQRTQKPKEKTVIYLLPAWFHERNVVLWGEKQLDPSLPAQIFRVKDNRSKASKYAYVLPESQSSAAVDSELMKETESKEQEVDLPIKEVTYASGGDNDPSTDSGAASGGPRPASKRSPILVPLPDSEKRYYIEEAQHNELIMTARGKLRQPTSGASFSRPNDIRGHLIIHYTAPDGELYLDKLIEDVARRLHSDLITLDAQDIVALLSGPEVDSMLVDEAKMMSYEVYSEIYKSREPDQDQPSVFSEEPQEDDDDTGPSMPQGLPFMIGKPITIDLKALFDRKGSRRSRPPFPPKGFMTEMAGPGQPGKPPGHGFSTVIDSVLSAARSKRQRADAGPSNKPGSAEPNVAASTDSGHEDALIIHIKDLKVVQETHVGKQFLNQLYEQVERRRAAGDSIMLVGTESSRDESNAYHANRIRTIQEPPADEISTNMVITPANPDGNLDFSADRARRISTINARHLWETLQSRNISIGALKPGFWTRDFLQNLHESDQAYLGKELWSFSHVQRLAAVIAGEDLSKSRFPVTEASSTIELSDKSKFAWVKQVKRSLAEESEKNPLQQEKDHLAKIREKANKHEKKLLGGVVEPKKIPTTFQDIHIPPETVDALQTLTTLSLVRPDAFKYGVLASDRIPGLLLYGPPGTGKTLAAKAVARESGATMLEVSAADINDMYVGEGEKNVKALFSLAKKLSPCVVFLDEADAMFSARSAQGRRVSHRELLNQFLKEWDGMSNDSGSAFIMVATNRPMDLDDAVLRRLPRRVLVDLPAESDRLEILKIHLRHEDLAEDVNLSQLATKTPFYSGSDLKNVAVSAALNAVREENAEAKKHEGSEPYQYPAKRTLTALHFEKALEEISASISEDMASLRDIKKFDEQYGDKKGRKRKTPKWGFRTASEADKVLDTIKVRS